MVGSVPRGAMMAAEGAPDYRFPTLEITAPDGPHAWLNRLAFVGTLHSLRPRMAVLVRVYSLG